MKLSILSYGGGQDSKAILTMLINDKEVRAKYAPDQLVVVMSDTGDEHDYTYEDLKEVRDMCAGADIGFHFLTADQKFHAPSWSDLITPQLRDEGEQHKPTMVQLGTKSCTANLKLVPVYKWLDEYVNELGGYDFPVNQKLRGCGKKAMKQWAKDHGDITMLIGFAAGEEKRADAAIKLEAKEKASEKDIFQKAITRRFPLVDMGVDRAGAQRLIKAAGYNCPPPSNCMRCPYMSLPELLWLNKNAPAKFEQWVEIEAKKIKRDSTIVDTFAFDKEAGIEVIKEFKNNGVFNGKKTLLDKLAEALEKFGHMTDSELDEYKFSHGCTKNGM